MIYLSGIKGGTYPIARRLPPSAGRFAGWDWARYFRIIHSLALKPYSPETVQRAVYAFQNLPPDMVFSDPISTAAWARYQELYQTRSRDVALKYMLHLPRMTRRYNPDDRRNWYDVEKEWQRSEAAQPEGLAGMDDLGLTYKERVAAARRRAALRPPTPKKRAVPVTRPPTYKERVAAARARARARRAGGGAVPGRIVQKPRPVPPPRPRPPVYQPPPVVEHPIVRPPVVEPPLPPPPVVEPPIVRPPVVEHPIVRPPVIEPPLPPPPVVEPPIVRPPVIEIPLVQPPVPQPLPPVIEHDIVRPPVVEPPLVRPPVVEPPLVPPPEVVPDTVLRAQVDRIIAEHVSRGTQSQIEASLNQAQIAYLNRTQPGWREHLRRQFPEPESPLEAAKERSWQFELNLPGRKAIISNRIDDVLRWNGQTKFKFPPIAIPGLWKRIVTRVHNAVAPKITRLQVETALRLRGYFPAGEGVLTAPEQARRAHAARPPGYYPEEHEIGPVKMGIDRMLKDWQGKRYPEVVRVAVALPFWSAAERTAYDLAKMYNRNYYKNKLSFTRSDVGRAMRGRGYVKAPPVPKPPPAPYSPERSEPPPIREAFLEVLSNWRGKRYAQVRSTKGSVPMFASLARSVYNIAWEMNALKYKYEYRVVYNEVKRALYKRNYAPAGTAPPAAEEPAAPPPPVLPVVHHVVPPPPPTPPPVPVRPHAIHEPPPMREAIDRLLRKFYGEHTPYVADRIVTLPFYERLIKEAYLLGHSFNRTKYRGRYNFTRADVREAVEKRRYRPKGWEPTVAPPPVPLPVPPPVPPAVEHVAPYDRMEEMPPIREAIDFTLKKWRGFRFPYVAAKPTAIISFYNLLHVTSRRAKAINSRDYDGRYKFNRADVRRALEGRRYRPSGWKPKAVAGTAPLPAPPPVAGIGSTGYYVTLM